MSPRGYPGRTHGLSGTYHAGCRCDDCRTANSRLMSAYRARHPGMTRAHNLRQFHGITPAEYAAMLEAQGGVCAACGLPETGQNQRGVVSLAVDHDHTTGANRGLLCMRCNRALGLLGDDSSTIQQLLAYRRAH
jgi:hypothetical protein